MVALAVRALRDVDRVSHQLDVELEALGFFEQPVLVFWPNRAGAMLPAMDRRSVRPGDAGDL
jgi:hypothetical protein